MNQRGFDNKPVRKGTPLVAGTFGAVLGFEIVERIPGKCVGTLKIRDDLLNPQGALHGGVTFSIADSIMGVALYDSLADNETCATDELKIKYLKFVRSGNLECIATLTSIEEKKGFVEAKITNDGIHVAKITGTFHIIKTRNKIR